MKLQHVRTEEQARQNARQMVKVPRSIAKPKHKDKHENALKVHTSSLVFHIKALRSGKWAAKTVVEHIHAALLQLRGLKMNTSEAWVQDVMHYLTNGPGKKFKGSDKAKLQKATLLQCLRDLLDNDYPKAAIDEAVWKQIRSAIDIGLNDDQEKKSRAEHNIAKADELFDD